MKAAPTTKPAEPVAARSPRKPFITQRKANDDPLQAELAVGAPGDRWEREADHAASRAVDGNPGNAAPLAANITRVTPADLRNRPGQRKANTEHLSPSQELAEPLQSKAEDDTAQMQADPETTTDRTPDQTEEPVQALALDPGGASVSDTVSLQMARAKGQGTSLPPNIRDKMQSRFGADFAGVRIHTDSAAVQLTRLMRARAVTRGADIFFNAGRFDPASRAGQHLLAHELTHTLQQGATQADPAALQLSSDAADSYETRPEILTAIALARGEIGQINAKGTGPDGNRIGWQRLKAIFDTALGGPVIHDSILQRITPAKGKDGKADILPSWCGLFTWWAMKKAGIPVPDWKLGAVPLDALQQRGPTELPRKGDIAIDVIPNNHFAMVTGLESSADADGKSRKLTRIATINGNTAGEDNLGGQVQEKWHQLDHWDHFLDPVGKIAMPPAPLVTVARTPDPIESAPTPPAAGNDAAEPQLANAADLANLETAEVATPEPEPEAGADALPLADLTLPPRPDAGPADVVAEVTAISLKGTSDQAAGAYLAAGPSAMAATQPGFASAVSGKMAGEQADLAANPPEFAAKTAGEPDLVLQPIPEIAPAQAEVGEALAQDDPGALGLAPETVPDDYDGNQQREEQLEKEDSGSIWDAFTNFLKSFMDGIKTEDPSISTKAGSVPGVALTGDARAGRMDEQRQDGATSVAASRDSHVTAFKDHPGQSNVQPRAVDESFAAQTSIEPPAPVEEAADTGMADYAAAPIPEDVRAAADAKLSVTLDAKLAGPKAEIEQAALTRNGDTTAQTAQAKADAATINADADRDQRKAVLDNRAEIARLQGEGMTEAKGAVNAFNKDAAAEQNASRKGIAEHVKQEEGKAKAEITAGEAEALRLKVQGEKDAAIEKAKLKEAQKNQSWWSRAKGAIKGAVKAITNLIDRAFTALRKAVGKAIKAAKDAAIGLINKARNWAINKINDFRNWAIKQVDTYLKDTFPGLAKRINGAINSVADGAINVVNTVADGAIAGVKFVADKLAKVLDKILSVFQTALKTAVRVAGAVATGDFAEALRAVIEGACDIAGISPKPIFDFFDRAGAAVSNILRHPVTFIGNLFSAVGSGISGFFQRIRTHMIAGVIGWLTGALAEVQLTGPFEFTLSGVFKIVMQILGLTYANIKARVIAAYPPSAKVFDLVESGLAFVKRLIDEGPMALLDEIVAKIGDLKEMVMSGIREWLIVTALEQGAIWLLSLTNPASAIVKAIKLVFDLVKFLVQRFQQIKDFVVSVYDAVAAMASGNFAAVTKGVEDALVKSIPVLISLIATVAGLGDIAKQVKGIIAKITKPINKVIDAVVKRIVAFAKTIVKKVKAFGAKAKKKAKDTAQKVKDFLWPKKRFQIEGEKHTLYFETSGGTHTPYIRSTPTALLSFVTTWETNAGSTISKADQAHVANAKAAIQSLSAKAKQADALKKAKKTVPASMHHDMLALQTTIATALKGMLGRNDDMAKARERYKLEGLAGTFGTVPKPVGDNLTGDHQPQAATIKFLASRPYFNTGAEGAKMRHRAGGTHADNAYVVNLQNTRHKAGRTYGSKGGATSTAFQNIITTMEKTTADPADRRKKAVALLKSELTEDVGEMRAIYKKPAGDVVWSDLDSFTAGNANAKAKEKEKLVTAIRAQVANGETLLANQPMKELEA